MNLFKKDSGQRIDLNLKKLSRRAPEILPAVKVVLER